MSGIKLTDEQRMAVKSLDSSCIVTAGAGSGKTRVLVERYLHILEKHALDPGMLDRIVAITFTEKAATEMKERIRDGVRQRLKEAEQAGDGERMLAWSRIVPELDRIRVTTIHAFCQRLLRRYPVETAVDPRCEVLEEAEARSLLLQAAETALAEALEEWKGTEREASLERWLVDLGIKSAKEELAGAVSKLFTLGWTLEELKRATEHSLAGSEAELERQWQEDFPVWVEGWWNGHHTFLSHNSKASEKLGAEWGDLPKCWRQARNDRKRRALLQAYQETLKGLRVQKDELKNTLAGIKECANKISTLVEHRLRLPEEKTVLSLFCDLIGKVVELYQKGKAERNGIDFDEMQWRVVRLLERNSDVLQEVAEGIRYLMVDEYQDTNGLQKRLIDLLIRSESGEVVPGKLFVVGDPKQSIYRFRGADVSLFHRTGNEITEEHKGKEVKLTANFRSHPELVAFFNHFFSRLMSTDPTSPNHYAGVVSPFSESADEPVVEVIEVPEEIPEGVKVQEAEAGRLALHLRKLLDAGVKAGDVAILFRAMTHVKTFERALARFGIPFYVVKGRGFYDKQEVQDCLHLLRWLVRPEDRLSLLGVLRSPFCGVSDETIFRIALDAEWKGEVEYWAASLDLPEEERRKLERFATLASRGRERIGTLPVAELLEWLLEESDCLPVFFAMPDGKQAVANLKKLVAEARALPLWETNSISHFLQKVEQIMALEEAETEAAIESEQGDSVKLMTVHQAKGLEFPVVCIVDMGRGNPSKTPHLEVDEEFGLVMRLPEEAGERSETERFCLMREKRVKLETEEAIRLLYVAMTRAEQRLILCCRLKKEKEEAKFHSWNHWVVTHLGEENIDRERGIWQYDPDRLPIRLIAVMQETPALDENVPSPFDWEKWLSSKGEEEPDAVKMLEPRGLTERDRLEISVTEWKAMLSCPRQYFYRHVAGFPRMETKDEGDAGEKRGGMLTSAKRGTIVHRILELMAENSFRDDWRQFAVQAFDEEEVDPALHGIALSELEPYMRHFLSGPMLQLVGSTNECRTEQSFFLAVGGLRLFGVIDLLLRHADGVWEVVDYKTDAVTEEEVPEAALEYEPQLQLYVLAAERLWGIRPKRATLYFLGPNVLHSFPVTEEWLALAENRLHESASLLRRTSMEPWDACPGKRCGYCDFRWLCDAAEQAENGAAALTERGDACSDALT
jgi:ATP-dependent exoDNAse (exonuclease V) beta subunit